MTNLEPTRRGILAFNNRMVLKIQLRDRCQEILVIDIRAKINRFSGMNPYR